MSAPSRTFEFCFSIPSAHPALPGHFPGRPIVPGALLLDCVLTGAAAVLNRPVTTLQKIKFVAPLLPGESATVACEAIGDQLIFFVQTSREGISVMLANGNVHLAQRSTPAPPAGRTRVSGSFQR